MVVKGIFLFVTMTNGCKKGQFHDFFNEIYTFDETYQKVVSKMPYSWENPMKIASLKLSVMVAKRKISFATMTYGFKGHFYL